MRTTFSVVGIVFSVVFIVVYLYLLSAVWGQGYEAFVHWGLAWLHRERWYDYTTSVAFPPAKFAVLRWAVVGLGVLLALGLALGVYLREVLLSAFTVSCEGLVALAREITAAWHSTETTTHKYAPRIAFLLLALAISAAAYRIVTEPINYDEAWSYVYCIRNGVFISATFLPYTNNHPLFSIVASLAVQATGWAGVPALVALRLPSVVFGAGALWVGFALLRRWMRYEAAVVGLAVFAFSNPMASYMLYGRGYAILVCFLLLHCYTLLQWLDTEELSLKEPTHTASKNVNSLLPLRFSFLASLFFAIFAVYTVATALYALAPIGLLALGRVLLMTRVAVANGSKNKFRPTVRLLMLYAGVAMGVGVLYAPFFFTSDVLGAFAKSGGVPHSWQERWEQFVPKMWGIYGWQAAGNVAWCAVLFGVAGLGLLLTMFTKRPAREGAVLAVISLAMPVAVHWLQGVFSYERFWVHNAFFLAVGWGLAAAVWVGYSLRLRAWVLGLAVLVAAVSGLVVQQSGLLWYLREGDVAAETHSRYLLANHIDTLYLDGFYEKPALEFYRVTASPTPLRIFLPDPASKDYATIDSTHTYPALLWERGEGVPCHIAREGNEYYQRTNTNAYSELWIRYHHLEKGRAIQKKEGK